MLKKEELIKLMEGHSIRMKKKEAKKIAKKNTVIDEILNNINCKKFNWIELLISNNGIRYYIGNSIQEINNIPPISQESFSKIQWNNESIYELYKCYIQINYNIKKWKLKKYHGWSNYYTWCINLWITNNESDYNFFIQEAKKGKNQFTESLKKYTESIPDFNKSDIEYLKNNFSIIDTESIYNYFKDIK